MSTYISQSQATSLAYLLESYVERSNLLISLRLNEESYSDTNLDGTITTKNARETILARIKDLRSDIVNSMEHYKTELCDRIDKNGSIGADILYNIDKNLEVLISEQGNRPIDKEGFDIERKFSNIESVFIPYILTVTNTMGKTFSILMYSDGKMEVQLMFYNPSDTVKYLTKVHDDISNRFSMVSRYNELIYRIIQNTISLKHLEANSPKDEDLASNKKYNNLKNTLLYLKISLTKWGHDGNTVGTTIEEHLDNLYLNYLKTNSVEDMPRPIIKLAYGTTYESMSYKVYLEEFSVTFKCYDNGFRVEL